MSSDCDKATEVIYSYLDKEMTWMRRTRVRWHLRRCPPCTGAFAFEDRLRIVMRERCQEEIPADLLDRVRSMLRQVPPTL